MTDKKGEPAMSDLYRKKPVTIEAFQFKAIKFPFTGKEFPGWFFDALHKDAMRYCFDAGIGNYVEIRTLEGVMTAKEGDWIIKGVAGEFYPCKPEIFEATYETADAPSGVKQSQAYLWLERRYGEAMTDKLVSELLFTQPRINPNPPEMKIVWYESPEAVHAAFLQPIADADGLTAEDLEGAVEVGETEDGRQFEMSIADSIEAVRAQGCWGFADTNTNIIHAWADPGTDRALLMHFLAHEIGHLTGTPLEDEMHEEMRAEQFGRTARLAYTMLQELDAKNGLTLVPNHVVAALKGWTGSEPSVSVLARAVDAWLDPPAVWEHDRPDLVPGGKAGE